jgi:hypothetical protein
VLGAIALTSSGFLIGSSPDEEEFRFAIVTSWLHSQSLLHGDYGFWTPLLGLGIPQPLTPNFWLHPLLPLLPWLGPVMWVRVLLLTHTLLGAAGMWQLTKTMGLQPITRAVCVVTFVLAAPVCNYLFTDFWPSHYVVWTSMPWVLVLVWRTLDGDRSKVPLRSLALGLSAGLVMANTNPGHILVYITLLLAVALTNLRRLVARWRWIALAMLIAGAIASPNIAQLTHERRMFDPNLGVDTPPQSPDLVQSANRFLQPLVVTGVALGPRPFGSCPHAVPLAAPFAALSIVGCLACARRRPELVVTLVTAAFMLFHERSMAAVRVGAISFSRPADAGGDSARRTGCRPPAFVAAITRACDRVARPADRCRGVDRRFVPAGHDGRRRPCGDVVPRRKRRSRDGRSSARVDAVEGTRHLLG